MPWLLLFFAMPIIEMYLLITVAGYIDALPTIGLVMLTAVIGVTLLRYQGLETLMRGTQKMRSGQMPAQEVAEQAEVARLMLRDVSNRNMVKLENGMLAVEGLPVGDFPTGPNVVSLSSGTHDAGPGTNAQFPRTGKSASTGFIGSCRAR